MLLRLAEPLRHHLEESPRHLGVRLDERPELPGGQAVAGEIGVGRDRRGAPGLLVDQGYLAEVVAWAEPAPRLAMDVDARGTFGDHEEADATRSLDGDGVAGAEV